MVEAKFYHLTEQTQVKCDLCPHECIINDSKSGICKVRKNSGGKLYSLVYGHPVAIHFDPVEKKPLYHFFPGASILSVGTIGCNMKCFFCQNSEISQVKELDFNEKQYPPDAIIQIAGSRKGNIGVAYTYNEPVIYFEYMIDIAKLAKNVGLRNVMVTNGFINDKPLEELLEYIDAFNVDLKSFRSDFYKKYTHSDLEPVLKTIKSIHKSGRHLELTNLVIPGLNDQPDSFRQMMKWIKNECGELTVLHISRYFPRYKSNFPPTPIDKLNELYHIASEYLHYVYTGNYESDKGKNTVCPACNSKVIERQGYYTNLNGIDSMGNCVFCSEEIIRNI